MPSDFEARARQRQANWQGASAGSHQQMADHDRAFWRNASSSLRFDTVWEMALEAWSLKRGAEPAPRLFGSPVGIRRRER